MACAVAQKLSLVNHTHVWISKRWVMVDGQVLMIDVVVDGDDDNNDIAT
jgi:hypothetical protein